MTQFCVVVFFFTLKVMFSNLYNHSFTILQKHFWKKKSFCNDEKSIEVTYTKKHNYFQSVTESHCLKSFIMFFLFTNLQTGI